MLLAHAKISPQLTRLASLAALGLRQTARGGRRGFTEGLEQRFEYEGVY